MVSKIVSGDCMAFTRLKERRIYEGYTQKEIAELLNVKRATYAGWETGKDIIPLKRLFALSNKYLTSTNFISNLYSLIFFVHSLKAFFSSCSFSFWRFKSSLLA